MYFTFETSRPIQHNKALKLGDRGRDTEEFKPHGSPSFVFFCDLLCSSLPFLSSSLLITRSFFLFIVRFLFYPSSFVVYILFLLLYKFFCFSVHDVGFFLQLAFSLFLLEEEKNAFYSFYSFGCAASYSFIFTFYNQPLLSFSSL